jgi:hypothetical protein
MNSLEVPLGPGLLLPGANTVAGISVSSAQSEMKVDWKV